MVNDQYTIRPVISWDSERERELVQYRVYAVEHVVTFSASLLPFIAIFAAMFIVGFKHGAAWTFLGVLLFFAGMVAAVAVARLPQFRTPVLKEVRTFKDRAAASRYVSYLKEGGIYHG